MPDRTDRGEGTRGTRGVGGDSEDRIAIWEIAKSSLFGTTHLSACKILIGRIEARENAGPKLITVEFVKTGEAEAAEKDTGGGLNVDPERKHER